ncbi:MAG: hypothetical protein LBG52_01815 [Candidatus Peribacteria bacterium]|nr:hypothetical protein [Candidatus Peribacteria bacterium]
MFYITSAIKSPIHQNVFTRNGSTMIKIRKIFPKLLKELENNKILLLV